MLIPKKTKYRYSHIIKYEGHVKGNSKVNFGDYGLQAKEERLKREGDSPDQDGEGAITESHGGEEERRQEDLANPLDPTFRLRQHNQGEKR